MQPAESLRELKHFNNQEYDLLAMVLVLSTHGPSSRYGFKDISCHKKRWLQESHMLPGDRFLMKDNLNERQSDDYI